MLPYHKPIEQKPPQIYRNYAWRSDTDPSNDDGIQVGQIVLGAWGCGAFGNDVNEIADLFDRALQNNFQGAYRQVIFAIVDWSAEKRFKAPFQRIF